MTDPFDTVFSVPFLLDPLLSSFLTFIPDVNTVLSPISFGSITSNH